MNKCLCGCGRPPASGKRYAWGHTRLSRSGKFPLAVGFLLSPEDEEMRDRYLWRVNHKGYVIGGPGFLHRQIMERAGGTIPKGMQVDHINENKMDNRRENLRVVSGSHNVQNVLAPRKNKKSPGPRGVYPTPGGKWQVMVRFRAEDGTYKTKHVGVYETIPEAAAAFDAYKRSLPGFVPPEERPLAS